MDPDVPSLIGRVASQAGALALAASLLLSPASLAEDAGVTTNTAPSGAKIVRLPASTNPEVFAAQKTLVEAWTIVGECMHLCAAASWSMEASTGVARSVALPRKLPSLSMGAYLAPSHALEAVLHCARMPLLCSPM